MKVLLGIPTSGAPTSAFLESLSAVQTPDYVTGLERSVVVGNFVPAQRELIVEKALASNADAVIMCDDDMVLPPEAFIMLLDLIRNDSACGLAGALYYSRDGFRPMTVDGWNPENTTSAAIPAFASTPVRVDGIGFGCVAISSAAIRRLVAPYFDSHVYIERAAARVRICDEDYLFCAKIRSAGYEVVLHPGVRCGHYDRASGNIAPGTWEAESLTAHRRIAVVDNGVPTLVKERDLADQPERHEVARVTYIRAD
jgi:GT2 family glycosyltransferase